MPSLQKTKEAFAKVLEHHQQIKFIVWDLDETLGPSPGWSTGSLRNYVYHPVTLKNLIEWIWQTFGVKSTIVSRNSAFCGNMLFNTAQECLQLGFHGVGKCPRAQMNRAKTDFIRINPDKVLLLDDQRIECQMAANHGSFAILCPPGKGALDVLSDGRYELYKPGGQLVRA